MTETVLEWSDQFSTDIVSIDRQHQNLLQLLQNLQVVLPSDDKTLSDKQGIYMNLVDHALMHFEYEERIMRNIGYPGIDEHIQEHDELRTEIGNITKKVMDGKELEELIGLVCMVQVWLLRHISASDTKIRDHLHRDDNELVIDLYTGT
ncbi:MAG: bacteriohemerythrin [Magnetovibrio sp.]|nr:bacteriohemerythrin [Magnetovibrio sp.]